MEEKLAISQDTPERAKDERLSTGSFLTGEERTSSSFVDSSASGYEPDEDESWPEWYIRQRGHEMLCEVEKDFLHDEANLNGLRPWEQADYDLDSKEPTKQIDAYVKHIFQSAVELMRMPGDDLEAWVQYRSSDLSHR